LKHRTYNDTVISEYFLVTACIETFSVDLGAPPRIMGQDEIRKQILKEYNYKSSLTFILIKQ